VVKAEQKEMRGEEPAVGNAKKNKRATICTQPRPRPLGFSGKKKEIGGGKGTPSGKE